LKPERFFVTFLTVQKSKPRRGNDIKTKKATSGRPYKTMMVFYETKINAQGCTFYEKRHDVGTTERHNVTTSQRRNATTTQRHNDTTSQRHNATTSQRSYQLQSLHSSSTTTTSLCKSSFISSIDMPSSVKPSLLNILLLSKIREGRDSKPCNSSFMSR
jgi:hypothetical protein